MKYPSLRQTHPYKFTNKKLAFYYFQTINSTACISAGFFCCFTVDLNSASIDNCFTETMNGDTKMVISTYYEPVRTYLSMPKDIGFDYMETIISNMEDEGLTFTEAYDLFNELVDFVIDMERV